MKKSDIAMIILIASVSVVVGYFVARATPLGTAVEEPVTIQTMEQIEPTVVEPSSAIFNSDAINPAVEIQIDQSNATSSDQSSE